MTTLPEDEHSLFLGDCLNIMPTLPDGCADMILCDLPYGITENRWDTVIPFEPLWREYRRLCRGVIILTAVQPFTSALIMSNVVDYSYSWVWKKEPTGNLNAKIRPMQEHEDILVFRARYGTYNPQGLRPTTQKRAVHVYKAETYGVRERSPYVQTATGYPTSILPYSKERKREHPTQKPVALMEYLIRTYTNEDATVLDNCMGSGSTGVACERTGRRFIGIEKDATYFATAQRRMLEAAQ